MTSSMVHAKMTLFRARPVGDWLGCEAERAVLQAWGDRAHKARCEPPAISPVWTFGDVYREERCAYRRAVRAQALLRRVERMLRDRAGPDVTHALERLQNVFHEAEAAHQVAKARLAVHTSELRAADPRGTA